MGMPKWWGHVNKRLFNPGALKSGRWDVLTHRGRRSGRAYRTPLGSYEVGGTYIFILVYGSGSDWVQNILADGRARLESRGQIIELTRPRLISESTAWQLLDGVAKPPPALLRVNEFLQMDVASTRPAPEPVSPSRR